MPGRGVSMGHVEADEVRRISDLEHGQALMSKDIMALTRLIEKAHQDTSEGYAALEKALERNAEKHWDAIEKLAKRVDERGQFKWGTVVGVVGMIMTLLVPIGAVFMVVMRSESDRNMQRAGDLEKRIDSFAHNVSDAIDQTRQSSLSRYVQAREDMTAMRADLAAGADSRAAAATAMAELVRESERDRDEALSARIDRMEQLVDTMREPVRQAPMVQVPSSPSF